MWRILVFPLVVLGVQTGIAKSAMAQDGSSTAIAPNNSTSSQCKAPPFSVLVRRDFTDIGWLLCPQDTTQSVGAQVSATYNARSPQTTASVDGLAALVYRYYTNHDNDPFLGLAVGPFIQGDGTNQFEMSGSPNKSTDTVTAGGVAEFGVRQYFGADHAADSYFRIHGGEAFAPSGVTTNAFTGEWLPTIADLRIHYPFPIGPYFTARFDPELMVQYDQLEAGKPKYLLFSSQNSALRIGPQLSLWLHVAPLTIYPEPIREFFRDSFLTATYHVSQDIYSGRNYSWSLVTLTHNLDPKGNFGISVSYGFGNSEMTGNRTDQVKVGLSGKL